MNKIDVSEVNSKNSLIKQSQDALISLIKIAENTRKTATVKPNKVDFFHEFFKEAQKHLS
jgi:hypothetical protein